MGTAKLGERVRARLESDIRIQGRRIVELETALHSAFQDSMLALSGAANLLFRRHGYPKSEDMLSEWMYDLSEKVLTLASPKPQEGEVNAHLYDGQRAFCPLCGAAPSPNFGSDHGGFAFPEGLRMHLQGKGNARECRIMVNASRLAKHHLGMRSWWE